MRELIVGGRVVRLDPASTLGKGGEADVYLVGKEALKVFKTPDHPDIASLPPGLDKDRLVREALARIAQHQKKLRAFPTAGIPAGLIVPNELATDRHGKIMGYTMPLVQGARELMQTHADRSLRRQLKGNDLVALFHRLHELVTATHKAGVVIGDFNDLNVLVQKMEDPDAAPFLIDADSMQFGSYLCSMFTSRFVDPLNCDPTRSSPMLVKPHSELSDWFSFLVMFFESLLWVHPYGGVHRPKNPKEKISHDARSLMRRSVLGADIIYPKPARPAETLPDDLLQYFLRVFECDHREMPSAKLLENLRWTTCRDCGYEHARGSCPKCGVAAPAVAQVTTIRGSVTAHRIYPTPHTRGRILQVALQDGKLRFLFEENGRLKREDGTVVLEAPATSDMRFRLSGKRTIISMGDRVVVVEPGRSPEAVTADRFGQIPMFDTNADHLFRVTGGQLVREGMFGWDSQELVGQVLRGQTMIWMGPEFGFGFYRAGALFQAFTFTDGTRSLNDQVNLPPIPGQLVDAFALFSSNRIWFFTQSQHLGDLINRVTVLKRDGTIVASHETTAGDGTWLSEIRGGYAATLPSQGCDVVHALFVPTDDGIVRVDADATGLTQTRHFADTEPFVDSSSRLFLAQEGIYVIRANEIYLLKMK